VVLARRKMSSTAPSDLARHQVGYLEGVLHSGEEAAREINFQGMTGGPFLNE
jgi:hypothetical protein